MVRIVDDTNFKVGDRAMVVGGSYYNTYGDPIYVTIVKMKSSSKVDILFDKPQKNPNTMMTKQKTWLAKSSLRKIIDDDASKSEESDESQNSVGTETVIYPDPPAPDNAQFTRSFLELERGSNLDDRPELTREMKRKLRDLCKCFKKAGFGPNNLIMLGYVQMGMREHPGDG